MQNMIKRIVDMDKQARSLTEQARERRENSVEVIEQKKEEARQGYLELAKRRVETIKQSEISAAERRWQEIEAQNRANSERLESIYRDNRDNWVDEIVARVIKGAD